MAKEKLPTASRSTGRLPTHRSMTKLNSNIIGSAGLDNKVGKKFLLIWINVFGVKNDRERIIYVISFNLFPGLHKSMSRLNTSQQNMARFSSSSQTVVLVIIYLLDFLLLS